MQNPIVKAVFFDIDGTLLSFKTHAVAQSTMLAIAQLKEKGIKVILSTGRSINSIDAVKHLNFDGFITFNGGYCVTKENEVLLKRTIDANDISAVLAYAKSKPLTFSFMSEQEITIHNPSPEIAQMYQLLNLPVPAPTNFDTVDVSSILQANIFMDTPEEQVFMAQTMPNSSSSRWTPIFADVNPKGQSKKNGIAVFCKHFDIDIAHTMAFGDGGNDIEMLQYVNVGVAMGNANPEVKAIANYVTTSVDEDGIYNALKHYKVI